MKINIAASHRFHLLDLARELEKQGHEVRFYSYVPTKRALKFGLKKECSYSLFIIMLPFLIINKIAKNSFFTLKLIHLALDYYISTFMKPCDIFIALGSVYTISFMSAKKKYNATTILEWGSKHILDQRKQFINSKPYSQSSLERDLLGYELADYISIPSEHVKVSFVNNDISLQKLIINPYGVDLDMFYPTKLNTINYDLIMVGGWRYEKGCDLLIDLCKLHGYTFLHVGAIVGMEFPSEPNFKHIDTVDQNELVNYYSKAKVFVLPSRSDGFGMVLSQALVCGLPIVCSKHTGGRDLKNFLDDKKWIIIMQDYTVDELGKCIIQALELANTQKGKRSYSEGIKEKFTWEAYGKRYNENLNKLTNQSDKKCK